MPVDLYHTTGSPPCLAVLLGAKTAGVSLNLKEVDFDGGEHLKPEFVKMNPQHTVPTMSDDGFILAESRTILRYLVDQYAKNDSLYPKDVKKRATVEQKLDFDIGTLFQRFADYYYAGAAATPENFTKLEEAFGILEKFLEGQEWVAGSNLTIADIAIVTTVTSAVGLGFSLKNFPNVSRWFEKCKKAIPSYEELSSVNITVLKNYFDTLS